MLCYPVRHLLSNITTLYLLLVHDEDQYDDTAAVPSQSVAVNGHITCCNRAYNASDSLYEAETRSTQQMCRCSVSKRVEAYHRVRIFGYVNFSISAVATLRSMGCVVSRIVCLRNSIYPSSAVDVANCAIRFRFQKYSHEHFATSSLPPQTFKAQRRKFPLLSNPSIEMVPWQGKRYLINLHLSADKRSPRLLGKSNIAKR